MFERFTNEARQVIVTAQQEAAELRHNYIGTEHLALGLSRSSCNPLLTEFGIGHETVHEAVLKVVGKGRRHGRGAGHIPFTPNAKDALAQTVNITMRYGHDGIEPEHILIAISEKPDCNGYQELGPTDTSARQMVIKVEEELEARSAAPTDRPLCGTCKKDLAESLTLVTIPILGETRTAEIAYCGHCGATFYVTPQSSAD